MCAAVTAATYSYRSDPDVPRFDDSRPLVIFDGMCVLCSRGVQWMLRRDPEGASRFAVIQDPLPRALYRHYGLDPDRFETFMVLADGRPHTRWAGVVAAGRTLPGAWRVLAAAANLVPAAIGDRVYDVVQRNRLAWFGNRETCYRCDAKTAERMLR